MWKSGRRALLHSLLMSDPWPIVLKDNANAKICEQCSNLYKLGCGCNDCRLIENKTRFYQIVADGKCPLGRHSLYAEDESL